MSTKVVKKDPVTVTLTEEEINIVGPLLRAEASLLRESLLMLQELDDEVADEMRELDEARLREVKELAAKIGEDCR